MDANEIYISRETASVIVVINGFAITAGSNPHFLAIIGRQQPIILRILLQLIL